MAVFDPTQGFNAFAQGAQIGGGIRQRQTEAKLAPMVAAGDYQGAAQYAGQRGDLPSAELYRTQYGEQLKGMKAEELAEATKRNEQLAGVAAAVRGEPDVMKRKALIQQNMPILQGMGMDPQQIAQFDPTDGALDMILAQSEAFRDLLKGKQGFTLGEGQTRFDPSGNPIASGAPKQPSLPQGMYINPETGRPEYMPEYLEGQRAIAEARGGNQNNVQSVFTGEDGMQYIVRRDGSFQPLGVKARNPYQITDVGGVPTAIDRQTGEGVAVTTPEVVGGNKATIETITEQEKFRREQQQNLPKEMATINRGVATLEALKQSPGFDSRYGFMSVIPVIPGTDMADTQALINQIGGQAFLTAFESLKGGGQITEIEGTKATQAITILTTQGIRPATAAKAIEDLIEVQKAAAARMQAQAGASYGPQGADAPTLKYNPATGEFE